MPVFSVCDSVRGPVSSELILCRKIELVGGGKWVGQTARFERSKLKQLIKQKQKRHITISML